MQDNLYSLDATEVIIRISADDVATFNQTNDVSIDQIKNALQGKETECYFQKLGEEEHRVYVPALDGQFEVVTKLHLSETYVAVINKKLKTVFRKESKLPLTDYHKETVSIRLIDINERGRATDEFDVLFKKVESLNIASNVNIENQQEIWHTWIEAQRAIIEDLQKPYQVKGSPSLQEVKNSNGDIVRYNLKFDLANEILPEYKRLEAKLKEYDIDCVFDVDGGVALTMDEIERVLDKVIKLHFSTELERSKKLSAVLKIRRRIDIEINQYLESINLNVNVSQDYDSGLLIVSSIYNKEIHLPTEILKKYEMERNGIIGIISKRNVNGKIERARYPINLRSMEFGKVVEGMKNELKVRLIALRKKAINSGYSNVNFEIGELYSFNPEKFDKVDFDDSFWVDLKKDFIPYEGVLDYNEHSQTISIYFETIEELENANEFLKRLKKFQIVFSPLNPAFKFKVKTNVIAKKSEKELFLEKIKMLRGSEFVVEMPIEESQKKLLVYLGKLNGHESDIRKFVLNIPNFWPDDKKKAKEILKFLNAETKPIISEIRANLTGDATKISWLQAAIKKITEPTEAPNGKAVNDRLGEFIFDTSKATPIYDVAKVTENSEYYWEVRNNELLRLNEPQRKAVLAAIHCQDLALLQGPPGTGKTTVIAEIIWQIISKNPKHKILLTSETNLAVDNALDRLLNLKGVNPNLAKYTTLIKPLRFGKMGKMDEEGAKYSVDRIMKWLDEGYQPAQEYEAETLDEQEYEYEEDVQNNSPENNAVQDWMKRIASRAKVNDPKYSSALKDWALDLSFPRKEVKQLFQVKYFEYANVVGSTCSSSGSPRFMWDSASVFSGQNTEAMSRTSFLAQVAPFGKDFSNQLNSYSIPNLIHNEFKSLQQAYQNDYSVLKNHFRKKAEDLDDEDIDDLKALITIGNSKIKSEKDSQNLLSYQTLVVYSKQFIAPFIEPKIQFDTVIMDEASKATPPELVLPLCFAKRSIVIGDHRQLPPMLNEKDFREALQEANAGHLADEIDREFTETSQFERMILNPKVSPTIISRCNIQYRMHPDINNVIRQFYLDEGGLEPAQELIENANDQDLNNIFSRHHGMYYPGFIDANTHIIWVDVKTPEMREGTSVTNEGEAKAVRDVLDLLKKAEGYEAFQKHWDFIKDDFKRKQEQEIGIISFYGAQKSLIKRALTGIGIPLKINTVDRFQGMERNIIIVSTVRSHHQTAFGGKVKPNHDSGFAKSPQRLNVALSRARRLLIVVGNKDFFSEVKDKHGNYLYKNAITEIGRTGKIIDVENLKKHHRR